MRAGMISVLVIFYRYTCTVIIFYFNDFKTKMFVFTKFQFEYVGLALNFDSPVALFFTPVTSLLLLRVHLFVKVTYRVGNKNKV